MVAGALGEDRASWWDCPVWLLCSWTQWGCGSGPGDQQHPWVLPANASSIPPSCNSEKCLPAPPHVPARGRITLGRALLTPTLLPPPATGTCLHVTALTAPPPHASRPSPPVPGLGPSSRPPLAPGPRLRGRPPASRPAWRPPGSWQQQAWI